MTEPDPALDANCRLLGEGIDLLDRLSDSQYADRRGDWAPVGAQYRHVLEHYQCFLEGLPSGRIDYDSRRRAPALERSRSEAAAATRAVRDTLAGLAGHPPRRVLRIQLQSAADAEGPEWSESTVGRELQFLVSHTVHHFALIRLLLGGEGPVLGPDFGVAPSTVAHTRTRA
jgi:hypothetical protein